MLVLDSSQNYKINSLGGKHINSLIAIDKIKLSFNLNPSLYCFFHDHVNKIWSPGLKADNITPPFLKIIVFIVKSSSFFNAYHWARHCAEASYNVIDWVFFLIWDQYFLRSTH